VTRLPDPDNPDLLATISTTGQDRPAAEVVRMFRAMSTRRTDRRPFADLPIPDRSLDRLRAAAEANGAHLAVAGSDDVVSLAVAAEHAATVELADPAYRRDLTNWFANNGQAEHRLLYEGLPPDDRFARYAVLLTDADEPVDWLVAGEALSAVLLVATAEGLATSPMSDVVEVAASRSLLRDTLSRIGYPAIVVRIGRQASVAPPPAASPRRPAYESVQVVADRP
jgi:hypothetical protein